MRKISFASFIILFVTILLASCGGWRDNIHLSAKNVEFSADGDSTVITTKGGWWITDISVNDTTYHKFDGVDVLSDHYKIAKDCFVIERRDRYILFISMFANQNNTSRILKIYLENGDYFDEVTVTQKAH